MDYAVQINLSLKKVSKHETYLFLLNNSASVSSQYLLNSSQEDVIYICMISKKQQLRNGALLQRNVVRL